MTALELVQHTYARSCNQSQAGLICSNSSSATAAAATSPKQDGGNATFNSTVCDIQCQLANAATGPSERNDATLFYHGGFCFNETAGPTELYQMCICTM